MGVRSTAGPHFSYPSVDVIASDAARSSTRFSAAGG
jgi:hypothetical protein